MAIPEKPESRAEMYLNKIASGSGTIPAKPESRLEQYLDAIANNGGGGVELVNVTFVSSDGEYDVTVLIPVVVEGSTFVGGVFTVREASGSVTIGFPKFGTGPVRIKLGESQVFLLANIGTSVMPQVSGDATLDMSTGEWTINGDCTFTATGLD